MNDRSAFELFGSQNPYSSALALRNSSYMAWIDQELVRLLDSREPTARARFMHDAFRTFIGSGRYPCLGAKAAVNKGTYRFGVYRSLASLGASAGLARDLCAFAFERPHIEGDYVTFVATFDDLDYLDERRFERALWAQLQALSDLDGPNHAWDPTVDADPESKRFAFSFAGTAFFVVGMHPGSSRLARRFSWPTLIFNAHSQFQALRDNGRYGRFVDAVRARELNLQGCVNPNLAQFGERSEASQYGGRAVEDGWKCPFRP
ncbi:MAG: YqcI/YcgG family protein [Candidatus Eremiobacteraeota bacterium]|nr:YqcI/YcgG family protein [Candidatus Eremiobacteraeota bacterium]MBC5826372.1 YqcI/YcgG family protein [Candidatus Eremiobacteraeota bacterium]